MKIKKIVVVGGGSAGWMTAAILIKSFPDKDISVIESPDIPRVGVGESTYDGINYFLEYLQIDRDDFFKYTDATVKVAIQFKDFYQKNDVEFCYPFGSAYTGHTRFGVDDWYIKKNLYRDTPVTDLAESFFPSAFLVKYNTLSDSDELLQYGYHPILGTALHFDAIKFADWLKNNYCLPKNVKHISKNVVSIKTDENGISTLVLDDGEKQSADLYIDCTGFSSILLDKTMKEKFINYNDQLVNNSAWATQIEYINKEQELTNVTNCTALKNGWVWNIPLWSRMGTGYVYSDNFISDEDAIKEFKHHLIHTSKYKRNKGYVDSLNFKNIKMRVGIHERVWVKNVVAIGLSAGFIEPLESNGLFSVHEFLFDLVRTMDRNYVGQFDIDCFNKSVRRTFDDFVEFIKLHYALSARDDSEYWKHNSKRSFNINIIDTTSDLGHLGHLQRIKYSDFNPNAGGPLVWVSGGMNYPLLDKASLSIGEIKNNMNYEKDMNQYFEKNIELKSLWSKIAKNSPSSYEFLHKKYYS